MQNNTDQDLNTSHLKKLFITQRASTILTSFLSELSSYAYQDEFSEKRNSIIKLIINSMISSPVAWDNNCQININWIGNNFISSLERQSGPRSKSSLDDIFSMCYRFLFENHLSMPDELSPSFSDALDFPNEYIDKFDTDAQLQIKYAQHRMMISIFKQLHNSNAIQSIKNVEGFESRVSESIKKWTNDLNQQEDRATSLRDTLTGYETAFNFVGLYNGFNSLDTEKTNELKTNITWMVCLGSITALIISIKLATLLIYPPNATDPLTYLVCIPVAALVGIFIYFFRISLIDYKSTKSQLIQIKLRKTLCAFIQGYVDYKKDKSKLAGVDVTMFEKIIFSNIVTEDDKIPSTFDGIEQIASIIKSVKK